MPVAESEPAGPWRLLALLGSELALLTALFYYFGWVRTKIEAERLGYDPSIMDLSTTEYLLKSLNALFLPLLVLLILALGLNSLHQRFIASSLRDSDQDARVRVLIRLLRWSWILWGSTGMALLVFASPPFNGFALPVAITLIVLSFIYLRTLEVQTGDAGWTTTGKALCAILLAFAVFWDVERLARIMGEGFAASTAANTDQLVAVTVYSAKSLEITLPGVVETSIARRDSAYRFRYCGLRLLKRSGDRYFLINQSWEPLRGRVIALNDNDSVRLDFALPRHGGG